MGQKQKKNEVVLKGRAVSRGVGIGRILCLHGQRRQFFEIRLTNEEIEKELRRFRASVRLAKRQLRQISGDRDMAVGENQASIFETHLLFLEDKSLLAKIEDTITREKVNAEWAVKSVTDAYVFRYKKLTDKHLREKYIDLEDIAERLLTALGGGRKSEVSFGSNTVVAAKEVNPTTLIEISQNDPIAIVTENGGWTSHTFILARELGIPAVTGFKGFLRRVETGDDVIVDGFRGEVTLNPSARSIDQFSKNDTNGVIQRVVEYDGKAAAIKTLDGVEITLRTNLDFSGGYDEAAKFGAKGIGLYRSEFLFNQYRGFPTEEEQFESYLQAADSVGKHGVKIRTFDVGIDQLAGRNAEREKNPALGLRAIRLSLSDQTEFRVQIRALLRASFNRKIDIVLPMISDVSEIRIARGILAEEKNKLLDEGIDAGNPEVGAMIEVPSAVLAIDKIVREVEFLSLGTNDLVQYLLAVDRDNEQVAEWFRTLHPAVLSSVRIVLEAGKRNRTPVIICGEMAGSPLYALILIGLGARELSMNLYAIPRVRSVINGIAYEEAREIVSELEMCDSADEVEEKIRQSFSVRWKHLFDPNSLPQAGSYNLR